MVGELIKAILPNIISCIELIGIIVVVIGCLVAFYHYIWDFFRKSHEFEVKYELAESLATGLEFKMAAEILKTVLIHDLNEIYILGAIIILRALLAFLIYWEMGHYKKDKSH